MFFRRPLFKTLPPVFPLPRGRGFPLRRHCSQCLQNVFQFLIVFVSALPRRLVPCSVCRFAQSIRQFAAECGRAGWGCGISLYPNAERAPCFSATPTIGIGTQPRQPISRPSPAAQPCYRPAAAQPSASSHCSRHPQPTNSRQNDLQAILHNHHPTQQKYNFVPFKSQK